MWLLQLYYSVSALTRLLKKNTSICDLLTLTIFINDEKKVNSTQSRTLGKKNKTLQCDPEILTCSLVLIPSANGWFWRFQWEDERLIQIELYLEVVVQRHQSHLWAFFSWQRSILLCSDWQWQSPPPPVRSSARDLSRGCVLSIHHGRH